MEAGFACRAQPMAHSEPASKLRAEHHQQLLVPRPTTAKANETGGARVGDEDRNKAQSPFGETWLLCSSNTPQNIPPFGEVAAVCTVS